MQNNVFFYIIVTFLAVNYSFIAWLESQVLRPQFLANQLEMVYGNSALFLLYFFKFLTIYILFWSLIVI